MASRSNFRPDPNLRPNLRLMEQVRQVMRYHHYKYRTEQTYCNWILRFIRFHGAKTHYRDMGKREEISPVKAGRYRRPPVVLAKSEVPRLLRHTHGVHLLMAHCATVLVLVSA